MVPEPEPLDPAPAPRRIARRTLALGLATVLVLTAGAWVAANELGYIPASEAEPTPSPSPTAVAEATPAPLPSPSPEPASPEPLVSDDPLDDILVAQPQPGGGGRNIVKVEKWIDNEASVVSPWNVAVALNERCTRCVTVAIAYQLTLTVDDPKETPKDVRDFVKEMDRELRAISNDQTIDVLQAATRLDAVIGRYQALKAYLTQERDEAQEETSPDVSSAPTEPPPTTEPSADGSGEPVEPAPSGSDSPSAADTPEPAPTASP